MSVEERRHARAVRAGEGHEPLIDHHPRGGEKRPFVPAQAERYQERSARAGEQSVEGMLWRALGAGARGGQGHVPFDVRVGGADGERVLCAAALKAHDRAARVWRP